MEYKTALNISAMVKNSLGHYEEGDYDYRVITGILFLLDYNLIALDEKLVNILTTYLGGCITPQIPITAEYLERVLERIRSDRALELSEITGYLHNRLLEECKDYNIS